MNTIHPLWRNTFFKQSSRLTHSLAHTSPLEEAHNIHRYIRTCGYPVPSDPTSRRPRAGSPHARHHGAAATNMGTEPHRLRRIPLQVHIGREGDAPAAGFSPRKANLAIYGLMYPPGAAELLATLGRFKSGESCIYVNTLADIDMDVLAQLIASSYQHLTTTTPN